MKPLKILPAIVFFVACSLLQAQDAGRAKDEVVKTELELATEKMAANIRAALAAFDDFNKPRAEKVKEFDDIIGHIQRAMDLVKKDGELHAKVKTAVTRAMERARSHKAKARAEDTPDFARQDYEESSEKFEKSALTAASFMIAIIETRIEMEEQLLYVEKNKEFYIDMMEAEQLTKANGALARVVVSMNAVTQALKKLGFKSRVDLTGLK